MINITQLTQTWASHGSKCHRRRGVAPVIATLLLVAIAVVGGSIVFVFAQGYISETQISGVPQLEYVKIVGYDARDVAQLKAHDGLDILPANCCGDGSDNIKSPDERIAIHIQNNSPQTITISELRFGGAEYQYIAATQLGPWQAGGVGPQPGEYVIMTGNDGNNQGNIIQEITPKIPAGGIVTLVLDLDRTLQNGRDMQVKLTTSTGNVFVSTVITGQNAS
jgi:flagellin-like protein